MESTAIKPEDRWFSTPDVFSLCRGGGNGPSHPSQMYAIKKYVKDGMSFLDVGSGSGTTLEALARDGSYDNIVYRGVDFTLKNVAWCKEHFQGGDFIVGDARNLPEDDKSWDVVYSRHVVDHLPNFEIGLNEQCRVAKELVIIVLWVPVGDREEHDIKNIFDNGKTYPDEYTNAYSRKRIMEAINAKEKEGWKLAEFAEEVGAEVRGHDVVICLKRF